MSLRGVATPSPLKGIMIRHGPSVGGSDDDDEGDQDDNGKIIGDGKMVALPVSVWEDEVHSAWVVALEAMLPTSNVTPPACLLAVYTGHLMHQAKRHGVVAWREKITWERSRDEMRDEIGGLKRELTRASKVQERSLRCMMLSLMRRCVGRILNDVIKRALSDWERQVHASGERQVHASGERKERQEIARSEAFIRQLVSMLQNQERHDLFSCMRTWHRGTQDACRRCLLLEVDELQAAALAEGQAAFQEKKQLQEEVAAERARNRAATDEMARLETALAVAIKATEDEMKATEAHSLREASSLAAL